MAKQNYTSELIEAVKNLMEWQVKNVDAFDNWAYNDAHRLLAKIAAKEIPTFDLDKMSWGNIKKAASESNWIPPEYCANDWEHDVCEFLRNGARQSKQEPYAYIDDKNRLVKISGRVYFDGGFVDANSEIPDSWKTLVLVEKVGA